ncbi:MAG: Putative DNA-binding protein in cluster with Type I restriction-modification system [uncultured Sulfurovum sp.]|uniref:DNA-binding protein in cluster with Type I restriction-modification system n=1 Tax=uncultured Sulfurovum sp. TaxID=269237 RepID=A0A6S6SG13_9BACT|nr:MAG: Putative DNA-binding protein in cluster with Type I restriction-modification system [uncultured Sulfurovum sp.]
MKRHKIIFYKTAINTSHLDFVYQDDSFWLSQKQIADLFGVDRSVVTKHIKNILLDEELADSTCAKIAQVQKEGNREVKREIEFYNLDMIISVGYRVSSKEATQFRIWATKTLSEFVQKGFVLDDERLKNGQHFGKDYFKELLQRIREIRNSERRIYQQITDIFAECCIDYDKDSSIAKNFYAHIQNKFHFAIAGQTAAEIVFYTVDSQKPNMGLHTWKNSPDGKVIKSDVATAKNYLDEKSIKALERISSAYFDYIEGLLEREVVLDMLGLQKSVDKFLDFNEYKVLDNLGAISHKEAKQKAEGEYDKFKQIQNQNYESDFDKSVNELIEKSRR